MLLHVPLKYFHVACVIISGGGFFVRGLWMLRASPRLDARWVRVAPHIVDTLLLASAIGLVIATHQYPLVQGWVTAKIFGLLAYIGLGTVALRRGKTRAIRLASWIGAIATFGYIVSVALTRNPWGFIAWF